MEQEEKITLTFSKKKFKNICLNFMMWPQAFFLIMTAAFRFSGWVGELPEQHQRYVLLGGGSIIVFIVIYYVSLAVLLYKYYKEEDRKNYFYFLAFEVLLVILTMIMGTMYRW